MNRYVRILENSKKYLWDGESFSDFSTTSIYICGAIDRATIDGGWLDKIARKKIYGKISEDLEGFQSANFTVRDYQEMRLYIINKLITQYSTEEDTWNFTTLSNNFNKLKARLKSRLF